MLKARQSGCQATVPPWLQCERPQAFIGFRGFQLGLATVAKKLVYMATWWAVFLLPRVWLVAIATAGLLSCNNKKILTPIYTLFAKTILSHIYVFSFISKIFFLLSLCFFYRSCLVYFNNLLAKKPLKQLIFGFIV